MARNNFETLNYQVSWDESLLDELNHITPHVQDVLLKVYPQVEKGKKTFIPRLHSYCKKYPRVPVFKNLLSTLYMNAGNKQKAYEINNWLVKEHPDYLFGRVNKASELLQADNPEEVPEILGPEMDIGLLYPQRKVFHVEEIMGYNAMVVWYYLFMDNIEQAENRVDLMEEIDPDHPKTFDANQRLKNHLLVKAVQRRTEEERKRKSVRLIDRRSSIQTEEPPVFNYPEQMGWLYDSGMDIDHEKIKIILGLDSDKLRSDLENLLYDSIKRFDYFKGRVMEENQGNLICFPTHALLLLTEVGNDQSLDAIIAVLRQEKEFLNFWHPDDYFHEIFNALYHCGKNRPEELFKFLRSPNIDPLSKNLVGDPLVTIIQQSGLPRHQMVEEYRTVLHSYLDNPEDENYIDTDATSFLLSDLINLGYKELLPEIKQLFEKELLTTEMAGDYKRVTEFMDEPFMKSTEFFELSIFEKYDWFTSEPEEMVLEMDPDEKEQQMREMMEAYLNEQNPPGPVKASQKIGRNDPCPCGSGKKYKKCCM